MPRIEKMRFETYLAVIENSVGARMFTKGYARINGEPVDIMKNGELSCAFFVSSILTIFKTVANMHATVTSTVKDMEASGWRKVEEPQTGDVIVWKAVLFPDGEEHEHIGFALSKEEAISNDYISAAPQRHDLKQTPDGTKRDVQAIYRGQHLFEN